MQESVYVLFWNLKTMFAMALKTEYAKMYWKLLLQKKIVVFSILTLNIR